MTVAASSSTVEASPQNFCHRVVSWLRLKVSGLEKIYDIDSVVKPIPGVIDVVAVSVERNGMYLMNLRGAAPLQNMWGQLGGKIEPGETIAQAAHRELFEEAGLKVEGFKFEFVTSSYLTENNKRYRIFVLSAKSIQTEPFINEPDKMLELRWFKPSEIPFFLTSATHEFFIRKGIIDSGKNARLRGPNL